MIKEIWRDIKGYEGLYQASNLGRIKSLKRKVWNRFQLVEKEEKILKPKYNNRGYVGYVLYKNNSSKNFKGHSLVINSFVKNVDNKPQINHKNGIKDDNRLFNLEYCTGSENIRHALENNLYKNKKRKYKFNKQDPLKCLEKYRPIAIEKARQKNSKPVLQYSLDGQFIKRWNSAKEAERFLNKRVKLERKTSAGFKWVREG